MLSWEEIQNRALQFSKRWKNAIEEQAEAQSFLNEFFNVFGVDRKRVALFEKKVPQGKDRNGYIDLLWKGVILVEMKSMGKSLDKAYSQAKDYAFNLEDDELPEYIMVCDFENIRLYRVTTDQVWTFKTSQLHKYTKLFADLAGYRTSDNAIPLDKEVDVKAAVKMAKLHDILKAHGYEGHQLEVYLVRLLFCLFADDTGIFEKNLFYDYISNSKRDGSDLSFRIAKLFEVLDKSSEQRDKETMLSEELRRFPYINGSLFKEQLLLADFDQKMREILVDCCSLNWGYISPAIFGAMFQGVMNPEERRELGAHYTSEENILKVIKPLFLDELWNEFERVKGNSNSLSYFHNKISELKFLDPACGCGNFLIITYRELRRLELEILKLQNDVGGQRVMDVGDLSKMHVTQFFGIEHEEFPCQIAKVGMWLMDHQMNTLVAEHFGMYFARLPLKEQATIVHGNALSVDWDNIVPKHILNYIFGNPPFVGGMMTNSAQKIDMQNIFGDIKGLGELDYVTAWYGKAAEFMKNTTIKAAFVSTNSITQGQQAVTLWKPLIGNGIIINFAYRTFIWSNEAKGKAAVHCVIVGFSYVDNQDKMIFDNEDSISATHINSYLVNSDDVFVESQSKPLCDVPPMRFGSMPRDGGGFVLSDEEREELIEAEPIAEQWIRPYLGSYEFINNKSRWCLWLVDANPRELKACPLVMERIERVRQFRANSVAAGTRKFAETPSVFCQIAQPESEYIAVPKVSSERRKYLPIGFLPADVIASDLLFLIPDATLYHFGVLTSNVHNAWMRTVCGRLKSDYRYAKDIVYNNFPWPEAPAEKKAAIEGSAQEILDVRARYYDSSLADLYDPLTMPPDLLKAHQNLDRIVMRAYGYSVKDTTEACCVADLMERYKILTNG